MKPTLLRRLWLRAFAATGGAAAVLLSWWWKVEDARLPENAPAAVIGMPLDLGRTILIPKSLEWRQDDDQLIMNAAIENVTGETQVAIFGRDPHPPQLILDGIAQDPPQVILKRDDQPLEQLQPRMPEEIAMIWSVPPDWSAEQVQVDFEKQAFKLKDNLYGESNWLGFSPAARLTAIPETLP